MPGLAASRPSLGESPVRAGACVAVVAGVLVATGALAPTAGAAAWGARANLSAPGSGGSPHVAILDDGRALVAWRGGTTRPGPLRTAAEVSVRPAAGGRWDRVGPLGPTYYELGFGVGGSRAVLALVPQAKTFPVPSAPFPSLAQEQRLLARVLEGGSWTRATALSSPRLIARSPEVGVDGAGVALAVWQEVANFGASGVVRASARPPGGAWERPVTLGGPGSREPAFSAAAAGALAAWVTDEPGGAAVWASAHRLDGGWDPPRRLSPSPSAASGPAVAVNAIGEAVVAWHQDGAILAATRRKDGTWTAAERISGEVPVHVGSGRPAAWAAIDSAGGEVVAWHARARPETVDVVAATRPAGGDWRAPQTVSQPSARGAGAPAVALRDGRALVVWSQPRGATAAVLMAREAGVRTGRWSAPERVSSPGESPATAPRLAIDARGRAVCAYQARRGLVVAERPPAPRPARTPVRLTTGQLLVNQRISQAALRRVNAVLARIDEGLTAADIRLGSLTASSFGPGVTIGGLEAAEVVDPGPPVPIEVAPAAGRGSRPELSAEQLLVNQRIAQAAVRRTTLTRWRLDLGLTGDDVRDGALGAAHLAPGLTVVSSDAAAAPPVPPPRLAGPTFPGAGRRVQLSREQLLINQRISQAAVRRANALVVQVESGFGTEDFRVGSIGGADLHPDAR